MWTTPAKRSCLPWCLLLMVGVPPIAGAADPSSKDLTAEGLEAWKKPRGGWEVVGSVAINPQNAKLLVGEPGSGVIYNGPAGKTTNIVSKESFGDIDAHFEFFIPKGSNAGVKFEGLYEVQIFDSHGKPKPTASDSGGIYPRAELLPTYHHIDEGFPPKKNAALPPGEWQSLDVVFLAPRFDKEGQKTANARFVKVVLNGQVVQEDVEMKYPTGHAWKNKEVPLGPLLLQADHGPVAFRGVHVRPLH